MHPVSSKRSQYMVERMYNGPDKKRVTRSKFFYSDHIRALESIRYSQRVASVENTGLQYATVFAPRDERGSRRQIYRWRKP